MQKKELTLIGVLIVLGVIYVTFFTDWLRSPKMYIVASARPLPGMPAGTPLPVLFKLNHAFELTSVKVVPLNGTNFDEKLAPVWYLTATTNSYPTKYIEYGIPVRGMHPFIPKARPDALEAGKYYRLLVTSPECNGFADFRCLAATGRR